MKLEGTLEIQGPVVTFIPDQPLSPNRRIRVVIKRHARGAASGRTLAEDVTFQFLTELKPFYSYVQAVRSVGGEFLDDLYDDEIAVQILLSSRHADHITNRPYGSKNDWFPGQIQQETTNEIYFHQFVLYDAAIHLILQRTASQMFRRTAQTQMGPIAVREPGSMVPELSMLISRLEQRRRKAEHMLRLGHGTYAGVTPVMPQANRFPGGYPYPSRAIWRRLN